MGLLSNVLSQSGKTQKSDRRSGVRPGETVSLKCARKDMKFIYLACIALFLLLSGCYDDKGNYDYSDLGEVLLKIDAEETVMYGETLEMSP